MSHMPRVELPGAFHLVERRVRGGQSALKEFHDRHLSLAMLHGSIYRYGIQLCGYNILSDRVLLVLIPKQPDAIGLALMDADRSSVRRYHGLHHPASPVWERGYLACPFADEVAWRVLRYVDMASVRVSGGEPFDRHALNSAAEHAGFLTHGLLTAPPERLPSPIPWRAFVDWPEDEKFVQALELCLRTGRPFGPLSFVRRVEEACGRRVRPACLTWPGLFDDVRRESRVWHSPGATGPASICAGQVAH
jgi:hypothetical protein